MSCSSIGRQHGFIGELEMDETRFLETSVPFITQHGVPLQKLQSSSHMQTDDKYEEFLRLVNSLRYSVFFSTLGKCLDNALNDKMIESFSVLSDSLLINTLNAELNPICYLLALLGAHHILHVSGLRVNII